MPISPQSISAIGAGVSGAAGLASGIIGSIMQKRENQRQRNYETEMYERSKNDNLDFWNMSNMYNSPEQQMQRLKSAGLNPNLAYGNGSVSNTADTIKAPSPNTSNSTNVQPVDLSGVSNAINQLYDLRLKDAQTNNVIAATETQKTNQELNAVTSELKRLEQVKLRTSNKYDLATLDKRINQLELQNRGLLTDMQLKRSQTRKTDTDRQNSIDLNTREWQKQPLNLKEAAAKIENIRTNSVYTRQQTLTEPVRRRLMELEETMTRAGINKNDSAAERFKKLLLQKVMGETPERSLKLIEKAKKYFSLSGTSRGDYQWDEE